MTIENTIHSKFLIHWTGNDTTLDNKNSYINRLKDVLQNGLQMRPGEETIYGAGGSYIKAEIARVCFTEIKLSQTEKHARMYGQLGVGFNRDFVLEREGNPVFYVQNGDNGHIIQNFDELAGWLKKLPPDTFELDLNFGKLGMIAGYLKNMSDRDKKELKYYDEMEWRVVHVSRLEELNNYIKYLEETDEKNKKIYRLIVRPEDIKLIIFPDNQIMQLALGDKEILKYFNSYMPTLIALEDCKNF